MDEVYSIRESLQGKLADFIRKAGFECILLEGLMRDLVVALASYREEDVPFFPEVYVFASPEVQAAFPSAGERLAIRTVGLKQNVASEVLKDCAPLAVGGWAVFIVKDSPVEIRYGLFRAQRHSLSTNTDEAMNGLASSSPVMLIRNRGMQTVELLAGTGDRLTAILKAVIATVPDLDSHIAAFVAAMVSDLSNVDDFQAYLVRLLVRLVQRSHGTLLAACPNSPTAIEYALIDSVRPTPVIDFYTLHRQAQQQRDANSLSDLEAAEALLNGMVGSDGLIVFSCDGKVLGYRSFLKPNNQEAESVGKEGGGRKRAFNLMKLRVPGTFSAVFIRSQDGETACYRSSDVSQ